MRMRLLDCFLPIMLLAPLPLAAGEIHRCVEDGRTVYTDQPCEDGEVLRKIPPLQETDSAAALERLIERNREYVERRRDRLAEARLERERALREQPQIYLVDPHQGTVVNPVGHVGFPVRKDREKRAPDAREERFSALSGPFPGTRRDARDPGAAGTGRRPGSGKLRRGGNGD